MTVHRLLLDLGLVGRRGKGSRCRSAPARAPAVVVVFVVAVVGVAVVLVVHAVGGLLKNAPHIVEAAASDHQPLHLCHHARELEVVLVTRRPRLAQPDGLLLRRRLGVATLLHDGTQPLKLPIAENVAPLVPHRRVFVAQLQRLLEREHLPARVVQADRLVAALGREVGDGSPGRVVLGLHAAPQPDRIVGGHGHAAGFEQHPVAVAAHHGPVGLARLGVLIARPVADADLAPDPGRHVGKDPPGVRVVPRRHLGTQDTVRAQHRRRANPDLLRQVVVQQERQPVARVGQVDGAGAVVQHLEERPPLHPVHALHRRLAGNRDAQRQRPAVLRHLVTGRRHLDLHGDLARAKPRGIAAAFRGKRVALWPACVAHAAPSSLCSVSWRA